MAGKMIDGYAREDGRIKVIHKKNGGRSDSRNVGIDKASGEYIALVDGDDFVDEKYIERLVFTVRETGCDVVSAALIKYFNGDSLECYYKNRIDVNDSVEAMKRMMYMKDVTNSAGGKLYARSLFDGVEYPLGYNYEDLATTYLLFEKAEKIAVIGAAGYYYRQNPQGIMRTEFNPSRVDGLRFAKEQMEYIVENYRDNEKLKKAARYRYYLEAVCICLDVLKVGLDKNNRKFYNECAGIVSGMKWKYLLDFNQTRKWQIRNVMICVSGNRLAFSLINRMTK